MNGEEMTFKNETDLENFAISSFALNYNLKPFTLKAFLILLYLRNEWIFK